MKRFIVAVALLQGAAWAQADTIYKCTDAQGKVTFTKQSCPDNSAGAQLSVENRRPSGSGDAALMAAPPLEAATAPVAGNPAVAAGDGGVTVVGGSEARSACSTGLSERDLRTAMVRKEIVPGMSRPEIESMFGKPSRQPSAQGLGTVTYWNDRYLNYFSIDFDRNGCVSGSYQSGAKQ